MPELRSASLPVEGGALPITELRREGTGPAVVIVPSIFGVTQDLASQMQEMATEAPYVAAMDPFFRTEPGPLPYDDAARAKARMQASDKETTYRDVRALIERARAQANGKVVALGICFGGPFCFRAAAEGAADGVVTWHGTGLENHLERAASMRCPMRLHFGDADPVVPLEAVDKVRQAFAGRSDVEIALHPGATHGFSHRDAAAYDAAAENAALFTVRELARELSG